jgi:hypothetical protein
MDHIIHMVSEKSTHFVVLPVTTMVYSFPMTRIQQAVEKLIAKHKGLRAAARATGLDHGYLCRLRTGRKENPSPSTLNLLGIEKRVTYHKANGAK